MSLIFNESLDFSAPSLRYQIDVESKSAEEVAREYLRTAGLLK